ncbi:hypothetical protein HY991_02340 [Candidatus Micrarchaeota archaeon]|nr:hypothetical protein [Candidatus Micrarchaeota archaeon]
MRKGLTGFDLSVAVLVAIVIFILGMTFFKVEIGTFAAAARLHEDEKKVFAAADFLVKEGLAEEKGAFIISHVLDERKLNEIPREWKQGNKTISFRIISIDGLEEIGAKSKICVKRLVLQGEETKILEVCIR